MKTQKQRERQHAAHGFPPPLRLRAATNKDAAAIRELVYAVLREHGLAPEPGATDADLDDIEATYFGSGGILEVLVDGQGRVVGSAGLVPRSQQRVELRKMYLDASLRGQGLGRRLLERALQQARDRGFLEVWLQTHSILREAIRLYEGFGFTVDSSELTSRRSDRAYLLRLQP